MVGEARGRSREAGLNRDDPDVHGSRRQFLLLEVLADDHLDALHIDQLEGERSLTGGIEARPAVLLSEPQELLRLTQLGPGEGPREQCLGEAPDVGTMRLCLANDPLRIAKRVRSQLLRVVGVIGRPTAGRLPGVRLHERVLGVDAASLLSTLTQTYCLM